MSSSGSVARPAGPAELAESTSPFADAAGAAFGGGWDKVIAAVAMVATFGAHTKGLVDAFAFVILLATLTTLVPYAYSAAAQMWLWLVERETFNPKHLVRDVVIAFVAFAYSVWAIAGAGEDIVTKGFVLLLSGIPVYIGMKWWQKRKTAGLTPPPPVREAPEARPLATVGAGDGDA